MMYGSWDIKCKRHNFLSFWAIFCPFTRLATQKILKKWKKSPGDTVLHMSTINQNQMMYDSWDMDCGRQNFFSFWTIFCPFSPPPPPTSPSSRPKNEHFKKKWQHLEISSFYTIVPKITIIGYTVPEMWSMMYVIVYFFHFGLFFALLSPNSPKNKNLKKI